MFLSVNQLDLIEAAFDRGPLDLLETHVLTVSALVSRGLLDVRYSNQIGKPTVVKLTPAGKSIGRDIDWYRELPTFKEVLGNVSPHKQAKKRKRTCT